MNFDQSTLIQSKYECLRMFNVHVGIGIADYHAATTDDGATLKFWNFVFRILCEDCWKLRYRNECYY